MTACPPYILSRQLVAALPSAIGQYCIEDSWVQPLKNANSTMTELYTMSAYFGTVTFMTVGFGDYSANNKYEVGLVTIRELHGDGDDGITAVMGLNFMKNTAIIAGMGTAVTV